MTTTVQRLCAAVALTAGAMPVFAQTAVFVLLGTAPGVDVATAGNAVTRSGGVVVGASHTGLGGLGPMEAFRWTASGGLETLRTPPGKGSWSVATGISADGATVVGTRGPMPPSPYGEAFVWTAEGGMRGLGGLPGSFMSEAYAVSADGTVVVGESWSASGYQAFRWTESEGMRGLGALATPGYSYAFDTSADGAVVVGQSSAPEGWQAFRWTQDTGMASLGDLPGGLLQSMASACSADGNVVAGWGMSALSDPEFEAMRWTAGGGMRGLGDLPGSVVSSWAYDVSADGYAVVGVGTTGKGEAAFLWTPALGMVELKRYLLDHGAIEAKGWTLLRAMGVSPDGRAIVGAGMDPRNQFAAWMAVLPEFATCRADCNTDLQLDAADFTCFQAKFAAGDLYADCNDDGALNLADFGCFQSKFALGCR